MFTRVVLWKGPWTSGSHMEWITLWNICPWSVHKLPLDWPSHGSDQHLLLRTTHNHCTDLTWPATLDYLILSLLATFTNVYIFNSFNPDQNQIYRDEKGHIAPSTDYGSGNSCNIFCHGALPTGLSLIKNMTFGLVTWWKQDIVIVRSYCTSFGPSIVLGTKT